MREKSAIQRKAASVRRWFKYRWRRVKRLPLGVLGVLVGMAVVSSLIGFWGEGWKGPLKSLGPELAGAVVTYVLLDFVVGIGQRKEALIARGRSHVRDVAVAATEGLEREGWLYDGSLRGVFWMRANLQEVQLAGANLEEAVLAFADLKRSSLWRANLKEANLAFADLERANLEEANLEGATLTGANLQGARLRHTNLERAHLRGTNLEGAQVTVEGLARAESLDGATLPDGTTVNEVEFARHFFWRDLRPLGIEPNWEQEGDWRAEFEEWRGKQEAKAGREDEGDERSDDDDRDDDDWDGEDDRDD